VNGNRYNIPNDKIQDFESYYPEAKVEIYDGEGGKYALPLSIRNEFQERYDKWSYVTEETKKESPDPSGSNQNSQNTIVSEDELENSMADYEESLGHGKYGAANTPLFQKVRQAATSAEQIADGIIDKSWISRTPSPGRAPQHSGVSQGDIAQPSSTMSGGEIGEVSAGRRGYNEREAAQPEGLTSTRTPVSDAYKSQFDKPLEDRFADARTRLEKDAVFQFENMLDKLEEDIEQGIKSTSVKAPSLRKSLVSGLDAVINDNALHELGRIKKSSGLSEEQLLARKYISEARDVIEMYKRRDGNWLANFADAFARSFDSGILTLGATDAIDMGRVLSIANKIGDKGEGFEKLTKEEQQLMAAFSLLDQIQGSLRLDTWQNIGRGTMESLPYLVEFALTGGVGAATSAATKAAAKTAVKKIIGKSASKAVSRIAANAGKNAAGRVAVKAASKLGNAAIDGLVGGAVMALTSGAAHTAEDVMSRMVGDHDIRLGSINDPSGELKTIYTHHGVEDRESLGLAFLKGFAANLIENGTEYMGNYMGLNLGKLLSRYKGGRQLLTKPLIGKSTRFARQVGKLTGFNGFIPEVAEEELGMLLNAATVGDVEWEDIKDPEQQFQMVMAVGIMSLGFQVANSIGVGLTYNQYRKAKKRYESKDLGEGLSVDDIIHGLDNVPLDRRADYVMATVNTHDLGKEDAKDLQDFVMARTGYEFILGKIESDAEEAGDKAAEAEMRLINKEMGGKVTVTLSDGREAILTVGNVSLEPNAAGEYTSTTQSGSLIAVPVGVGNTPIMVSPKDIRSVSIMSTEDAVGQARAMAEDITKTNMASQIENEADEVESDEQSRTPSSTMSGGEIEEVSPRDEGVEKQPLYRKSELEIGDVVTFKDYSDPDNPGVERTLKIIGIDDSGVDVEDVVDGVPLPLSIKPEQITHVKGKEKNQTADKESGQQTAPQSEITDTSEYTRFVEDGTVEDSTVLRIANKIANGEQLTREEEAMRQEVSQRVEDKLREIQQNVEGKEETDRWAKYRKSNGEVDEKKMPLREQFEYGEEIAGVKAMIEVAKAGTKNTQSEIARLEKEIEREISPVKRVNKEKQLKSLNERLGIYQQYLKDKEPLPDDLASRNDIAFRRDELGETQSGQTQINERESNSNKENSLSSQEEKQIDSQDEILQSIPQRERGTEAQRDRRMEETALRLQDRIEEAARDAQAAGRTLSRAEQQEIEARAAEEYAKENGIWIPMEETFSWNPMPSGNENDVYLNTSDGYVYKVNNLMNSKGILPLFDRIKLHNQIFPSSRYEFVGFTGFDGRSVYPIFRQVYVHESTNATPEEIDTYMKSLGFHQTGEAQYSNGEITISDLRPRNVLKSNSGNIYVVDAEFKQEGQSDKETVDKTQPRQPDNTVSTGSSLSEKENPASTKTTDTDTTSLRGGTALSQTGFSAGKDNTSASTEQEKKRLSTQKTPQERRQEIQEYIGREAGKLNIPVRVVEDVSQISPSEKNYTKKLKSLGWYDKDTGEIVIVAPNHGSIRNAQRTLLHEAVAHYGLPSMLGRENFDKLCDQVWDSMTDKERATFAAYLDDKSYDSLTNEEKEQYTANDFSGKRAAADEYLAHFAEEGITNPSLWSKIKRFIKEAFRKIGIDLSLTDSDIAYMLWKSKNRITDRDSTNDIIRKSAADTRIKEGIEERFRTVYHGSGASFDRFDHSFMGTGEGAQAYGWGTYVTEVNGIAKSYAEKAADPAKKDYLYEEIAKLKDIIRYEPDLYIDNMSTLSDLKKQIKELEEIQRNDPDFDFEIPRLKEYEKEWERLEDLISKVSTRVLYTVEIPDDTGENYLDWEQPVSDKQAKAIEHAAKQEFDDEMSDKIMRPIIKGNDFNRVYAIFSDESRLGSDKAASGFLSRAGFTGIKYPAQATTGGRSDGARNYVIFNENDLQITDHTRFRTIVVNPRYGSKIETVRTNHTSVYKAVDKYLRENFDEKDYTTHTAKTGSRYLELKIGGDTLKVRFANHTPRMEASDNMDTIGNGKEITFFPGGDMEVEIDISLSGDRSKEIIDLIKGMKEYSSSEVKKEVSRLIDGAKTDPFPDVASPQLIEELSHYIGTEMAGTLDTQIAESYKYRVNENVYKQESKSRDSKLKQNKYVLEQYKTIFRDFVQESPKLIKAVGGGYWYNGAIGSIRIVPPFPIDYGLLSNKLMSSHFIPLSGINKKEGKRQIVQEYVDEWSRCLTDSGIFLSEEYVSEGAKITEAQQEIDNIREQYNFWVKAKLNTEANAADTDTRYRISETEAEYMEAVNRRFNEELKRYESGEMEINDIFHLGNPQGAMRFFLPNLPIVMRQRVINKASNTKHNVDVESLLNLPQKITEPIFMFKRDDNTLGIFTEIKDRDDKNVCVAIELGRGIQHKGNSIEVNDVRSVHGREAENIIAPIAHNNTLVYADKEKGLDWLSSASSNYRQEIDKQDLLSATNIVENFENPKLTGENSDGTMNTRFRREAPDVSSYIKISMDRKGVVDLSQLSPDQSQRIRKSAPAAYGAEISGDIASFPDYQEAEKCLTYIFNNNDIISDDIRNSIDNGTLPQDIAMIFDAALRRGMARRVWIDRYQPLEALQKLISSTLGKEISEKENAWEYTGFMDSRIKAEADEYNADYYLPLLELYEKIIHGKNGVDEDTLVDYMLIKHGIERNQVMRREALEEWEESHKGVEDYNKKRTSYIQELSTRDYSGYFDRFKQEYARNYNTAEDFISEVESLLGENTVISLWDKIKKATNKTLDISVQSGLVSKEDADTYKKRFQFYVPLRGFSEETMDQMYDSNIRINPGSTVNKQAKGRTSRADNPLVSIMAMANTEIARANKNKMKQRLLTLLAGKDVRNKFGYSYKVEYKDGKEKILKYKPKPSDKIKKITTISNIYQLIPKYEIIALDTNGNPILDEHGNKTWVETDEVPSAEQLESGMARFSKAYPSNRGTVHKTPSQMEESSVDVFVAGKKVSILFTNPFVSNSINGRLNLDKNVPRKIETPDQWYNIPGWLTYGARHLNRLGARTTRALSQFYTTYSPAFFLFSNFARDFSGAFAYNSAEKSIAEARQIAALAPDSFAAMRRYIRGESKNKRYTIEEIESFLDRMGRKGKISKSDYDIAAYLFVSRGGETGYISANTVEDYRKSIDNAVKYGTVDMNKQAKAIKKGYMAGVKAIQDTARLMESVTRLNQFVAALMEGKTIDTAITDAKNVSTNFNRRGSHEGIQWIFDNYAFLNASLQGTGRLYRGIKKYKKGFAKVIGTIISIGFLDSLLCAIFSGDDDRWGDSYHALPETKRYNNLVIPIGEGKFIFIPLAQSLRGFHAWGIMLADIITGYHKKHPLISDPVKPLDFFAVIGQDIVPITYGSWTNAAPTWAQPIAHIAFNENFMGRPLYKETPWNENLPEFRKAYGSTPKGLVKWSEFVNEMTGGNYAEKGWLEQIPVLEKLNNPAVLQQLYLGYVPGLFRVLGQAYNAVDALVTKTKGRPTDFDLSDVPIIGAAVGEANDRIPKAKLRSKWYEFANKARDSKRADSELLKELFIDEFIENTRDSDKVLSKSVYDGLNVHIRNLMKLEGMAETWEDDLVSGDLPADEAIRTSAEIASLRNTIDNTLYDIINELKIAQ
jgi:hypothetical protein